MIFLRPRGTISRKSFAKFEFLKYLYYKILKDVDEKSSAHIRAKMSTFCEKSTTLIETKFHFVFHNTFASIVAGWLGAGKKLYLHCKNTKGHGYFLHLQWKKYWSQKDIREDVKRIVFTAVAANFEFL